MSHGTKSIPSVSLIARCKVSDAAAMVVSLRTRRAVFWSLGPDRIVAAVLSRGEREPLLEACAASYAAALPGACFAPGLLELAMVLEAGRDAHVAALGAVHCRVEQDAAAPSRRGPWRRLRSSPRAEAPSGQRVGVVSGAEGVRVQADENAVAQAAGLYRSCRLRLVALDCEPCALASLVDVLGAGDVQAARRQALSAVAVLPTAETAAEALGEDLAVPIGLALAWFQVGGGGAR